MWETKEGLLVEGQTGPRSQGGEAQLRELMIAKPCLLLPKEMEKGKIRPAG